VQHSENADGFHDRVFAMPKHSIVFLMYHELALPRRPICQEEPGYSRYVLTENEFRSQIEFLKQHGWGGLSLSQALAYPEGHCICITFDDGCETDLLAVAPILRQARYAATFFVTTGRLGRTGYLSHQQVRELSALGFEIGCHSMTHAYLTDLDEKGLQREICDAKSQLEQIVGRAVEHFSCPGGRFDQRVLFTARGAGYRSLSTSRLQANSATTNPFALGRVPVLRDISLSDFAAICEGTSLSRLRAQTAVRDIAKRLLGNAVYDRLRARLLRSDVQRNGTL
jgi:peptidoglycan/xylan/chitin deacetylase (PgdA/CDA1 family)